MAEYKHAIGVAPGETVPLADITGPGMIRQIWLTIRNRDPVGLRSYVLRIYWDDSELPSVEAPWGDFFGLAHGRPGHYSTPYLGVSEAKGYNCAFPMPFSKRCRITFENDTDEKAGGLFYQINYTLGDEVTPDTGRFHAHFRRATPPRGRNFVLLDRGGTPGVYVGTTISALPREPGTWREGEFRFFIDGDTQRPTIVGTGWSDWFLSAWGLGMHQSLYAGSNYQVLHPEMKSKYFCSCYRFHVMDPIYFQHDLRVEHTQIGGRPGMPGCTHEREDDWCSVAYWYQNVTAQLLPQLPSREARIAGIAVQEWEADALARMRSGVDRHTDGGGVSVQAAPAVAGMISG
ncbi:MAG: DUF2961 domain-containing protein [Kiritimatiellae bacterium]|nr:DUF2961 domain-containing protein [Kiritimatiellia bacterium]